MVVLVNKKGFDEEDQDIVWLFSPRKAIEEVFVDVHSLSITYSQNEFEGYYYWKENNSLKWFESKYILNEEDVFIEKISSVIYYCADMFTLNGKMKNKHIKSIASLLELGITFQESPLKKKIVPF